MTIRNPSLVVLGGGIDIAADGADVLTKGLFLCDFSMKTICVSLYYR
jgi:hypothetical protein